MVCYDCLSVKERNKGQFMDLDDRIHGIGVGSHALWGHVITAYVEPGAQVPDRLEGIRILKRYTDPVRTLGKYGLVQTLDSYVRPVSGGNSVGAFSTLLGGAVTGTVGMSFLDSVGNTLILSNNHVLCGIATKQRGGATPGAALWQPGNYFGGSMGVGNFASLFKWGPLDETGSNVVDWATGLVGTPSNVSPDILGVGTPAAVGDPVDGLQVVKNGALSGFTSGTVIDTNATVDVNYEGLFTATFDNQFVVQGASGPFAIPGDSGSAVVASVNGKLVVVGLLFSGSQTIAVMNKMSLVQQAAGVSNLALAAIQPGGSSAPAVGVVLTGALAAFLLRPAV